MRFWSTISGAWYDVRYGIPNLVRWLPFAWRDRDGDWQYLAFMMRQKLLWMAELEENHGHHVTSKADAKKQRICAELLRRVIEDSYADNAMRAAGLLNPQFTWIPQGDGTSRMVLGGSETEHVQRLRIYNHAEKQRNNDMKYFGHLLGKHLLSWWD